MKFTTNDLYKGASTMVFESRYEQASPIFWYSLDGSGSFALARKPGRSLRLGPPKSPAPQVADGLLHHPSRYHFQGHSTASRLPESESELKFAIGFFLAKVSGTFEDNTQCDNKIPTHFKCLQKNDCLPRRDLFLNLSRMIFSLFLA